MITTVAVEFCTSIVNNFSLGIKPLPDMNSSDSTVDKESSVEVPRTQTEQVLQPQPFLQCHCQQFSLGIKPIPGAEFSDSTCATDAQVELPQTHTQQGVEALEKLLEKTPEVTPDVDPEEVKPMGRLSRLEKALASEAA